MATFTENKPHVNVGTIGQFDHGTITLTAETTKVLAEVGKATTIVFDEIDKAPERRRKELLFLQKVSRLKGGESYLSRMHNIHDT